jgi:hypothetical protein
MPAYYAGQQKNERGDGEEETMNRQTGLDVVFNFVTKGVNAVNQEFDSLAKGIDTRLPLQKRMDVRQSVFEGWDKGATKSQLKKMKELSATFGTDQDRLVHGLSKAGLVMSRRGALYEGSAEMGNKVKEHGDQMQRLKELLPEVSGHTDRFKFEWLGLMFAGMALSRVFGGSIGQMMEMLGITQLVSTVMMMLLLPALIPLIPAFASLTEKVAGMSEEDRKFIGQIMVTVTAIGVLIMALGMLNLAWSSLVGLFGAGGMFSVMYTKVQAFLHLPFIGLGVFFFGVIVYLHAVAGMVRETITLFKQLKGVWERITEGEFLLYLEAVFDILSRGIEKVPNFLNYFMGGAEGRRTEVSKIKNIRSDWEPEILRGAGIVGGVVYDAARTPGYGIRDVGEWATGSTTVNVYQVNTVDDSVSLEDVGARTGEDVADALRYSNR